jgi:hypothetical protein
MLRKIVQRHPYAFATVLFIAVMTGVKLGAAKLVDGHGLTGTAMMIGAALVVAFIIDRP